MPILDLRERGPAPPNPPRPRAIHNNILFSRVENIIITSVIIHPLALSSNQDSNVKFVDKMMSKYL